MKRSPLTRRSPLRRSGWGIRGERKPMKKKAPPHIAAGFTLAAKGEHTCRNCGDIASDPHHAVNRSLAPREKRDDLRNLLPLCRNCHRAFHAGAPLPRSVFTPDEWAFVSTLIGPGWLARRYPRDQHERMAA